MSDETVDYLKLAKQCVTDKEYREFYDAPVYAAIAQAQALTRIATLLESFLEAYTDTLTADSLERTARIWGS